MLLLVVAEVLRERLVLALQRQLLGLLVEVGLEVLQRQREVEDVDVPTPALGERAGHPRGDGRGAVGGAGGERAADQERAPAHALDLDVLHWVRVLSG